MAMELYRQNLMKEQEHVHADENGVHVERSMDITPIIEGVKSMQDIDHRSPIAGARYIGSIDPITASNWAKECGAAIGTKAFAAFAKKKLQSGEFAKFAINHDRRIFNGAKLQ